MAWVNIFDAGPCRVDVYKSGEVIDPTNYAAEGIASVDVVDGEVVVTALPPDEVNSWFGQLWFEYRVVPLFDAGSSPVRVTGAVMEFSDSGYNAVGAAVSWSGSDVARSVPLSYESYPIAEYIPDPAEVTPDGSWDAAGITGSAE